MQLFRLCEITGLPHPDYLSPYLTATQITDWILYEQRAGSKLDIQLGLLTWVIARSAGDEDSRIEDYMPFFVHVPDMEEMVRNVQAFFQHRKTK